MMDDGCHTSDFDDKLEVEMSRLAAIKEAMTRSDETTEQMIGVLTSFEDRLKKLEDTVNPVYQETGNLQRRHENIEKTLNQLDLVIAFYHIAEEVEPVIREGPSAGDLGAFLSCMDHLGRAVKFFTSHAPDSTEMAHATTLFEAGKDSIERELRNLVTRHSRPVPPITLLDILAAEQEEESSANPFGEPDDSDKTPIEHLSAAIKQEVMQCATWLSRCGYPSDYAQQYAALRSTVILKSLTALRDHLKAGSKDSKDMSSSSSPALTSKQRAARDTPSSRKTARRINFVRSASSSIMKHKNSITQQLEAAGLRRQNVLPGGDGLSETCDLDIDLFVTAVSALLKLIQSEAVLMQGLILRKQERHVLDLTIQAALDTVIKEGEQMVTRMKQATAHHLHSAVLNLFPVLKHLRSIKNEYDNTLDGCPAPTRAKLPTLIAGMDAAGVRTLEDFVESIRNNPDKSSHMPCDGTVHELTSNTLIFLEQLQVYSSTVGAMLLTNDPKRGADPDLSRKVSEYVCRVLSALGLNLSNKSGTYADPTLTAIFLLNNYNYMLNTLKRTKLLELVCLVSKDLELHYEDQILEQKRVYSQSWSRCLHYILDIHKPMSSAKMQSDNKLKDKDRQAIKEKFAGFNKELEDLALVQKTYSIPDSSLRNAMREDNREFIMPKYQMFLDKYKDLNFTKNREKYVKYEVVDVERMINSFFDATA